MWYFSSFLLCIFSAFFPHKQPVLFYSWKEENKTKINNKRLLWWENRWEHHYRASCFSRITVNPWSEKTGSWEPCPAYRRWTPTTSWPSRSHHTPNLEVWQPLDFTRLGSLPPPLARHTHTHVPHTHHTPESTHFCVWGSPWVAPSKKQVCSTSLFARCWNPNRAAPRVPDPWSFTVDEADFSDNFQSQAFQHTGDVPGWLWESTTAHLPELPALV